MIIIEYSDGRTEAHDPQTTTVDGDGHWLFVRNKADKVLLATVSSEFVKRVDYPVAR